MSAPIPGWYPDPSVPGRLRWFDGLTWTDHVVPLPTTPGPVPVTGPPHRMSTRAKAQVWLAALAAAVVLAVLVVLGARQLGLAWNRTAAHAGSAVTVGVETDAPTPDDGPTAVSGVPTPEQDDDGWTGTGPEGTSTCEDLATVALTHADEYWDLPGQTPLSLTGSEVLLDEQLTADVPAEGDDPVLVLSCRYDATFPAKRVSDAWGDLYLYPDGYTYLSFS